MHTPSDELNAVNRLIHEPVRLAILTALATCESAEYLYLQRLTGSTGGNLASHVRRLAEAGLVEIHKGYAGNMPQTKASITAQGRQAIEAYWKQMEVVRDTFSDRDFIERWRTRERLA
jgi:DNA-binding MarR family transcriptional regulator